MKASHELVYNFFTAITAGELPDSLVSPDMKAWGTMQGDMDKASYQSLIRMLKKICARPLRFSINSITAEEDRLVAEVSSEGTLVNGAEYKNTYVFVFRIHDGRIASVAEHYNALIAQEQIVPLVMALRQEANY